MKEIMPPANDKLCFVIMPFQDDMKEVYKRAIQPACEAAGFRSLRVDELEGVFNINKKIIQNLFLSDAIIADLTHWRPNVFYEMGVAHAIGNKTIMIIQQDHKLPFDVSDYRCLIYQQTPEGLHNLVAKLAGALKTLEQWRQEPSNPVQDFMPPDAVLPLPKLNMLQRELEKAQHQLKSTVPKAELERAQTELREQEARRRESVPKAEFQLLQKALQEKEAALANSVPKREWQARRNAANDLAKRNEALQRENEALRARKAAPEARGYPKGPVKLLVTGLAVTIVALATQVFRADEPSPRRTPSEIARASDSLQTGGSRPETKTTAKKPASPGASLSQPAKTAQRESPPATREEKSNVTLVPRRRPWLRSTPATLTAEEVTEMLDGKGFYDSRKNGDGPGLKNDFVLKIIEGDSVVLDHETGLIWQQSGSSHYMTFAAAEQHMRDVNRKGFAGFSDWRLPTLEEGMSLMERAENKSGLYINPIFASTQWWIWTSDKYAASSCWAVGFGSGDCGFLHVDDGHYVRLVR